MSPRSGLNVISVSYDSSTRIWDASTGEEKLKLNSRSSRSVTSVAPSPDGMSLVSGSRDNKVGIWNALTGEEQLQLDGHLDAVTSVRFSPDGKQVVSGSGDNSVRTWDASTGKQLDKFEGHTNTATSVSFSPDGTRVISGSYDTTLRIWDISATGSPRMDNADLEASKDDVRASYTTPGWAPNWTLDASSGWVTDKSTHSRLIWLDPSTCGVVGPSGTRYIRIISRQGRSRLDLSSAFIGTDWANCYTPSTSS